MEAVQKIAELEKTLKQFEQERLKPSGPIVKVEKSKAETERALKLSDQRRLDAENATRDIEQTLAANTLQLERAVALLKADKADAIARIRIWEISTYVAITGLIVLLIILLSIPGKGWRGWSAVKLMATERFKCQKQGTGFVAQHPVVATQGMTEAFSPYTFSAEDVLIRELEGKSTDIKERDDAGKPDVSGNLNPDLDTTAENSQVDATSLAPQSHIPEGVETEPSLEQPNLDIAEVSKPRAYVVSSWRSLLFMIVFLASIPVTPVLYSASDNEVARAVVLLVPFCFFLLWVYYAVKALHLIGVHFWKLRSTRASLILIAVVICIAVLFFIARERWNLFMQEE